MYSRIWIMVIIGVLLITGGLTVISVQGVMNIDVFVPADIIVKETGVINQVTAILFDYRAFDTLGEVTVIFAAASIITVFAPRRKTPMLGVRLSVLVRYGVALILPILMVFGFYMMLFGHISPGGGFTGGVILSSISIIFVLTYSVGYERSHILSPEDKKNIEMAGMGIFLLLGIAGVLAGETFLTNARIGIDLGVPGNLLSGGILPLLNLASGIKVWAALAIIYNNLIKEN